MRQRYTGYRVFKLPYEESSYDLQVSLCRYDYRFYKLPYVETSFIVSKVPYADWYVTHVFFCKERLDLMLHMDDTFSQFEVTQKED